VNDLRARLYAFGFADELGPLYAITPVYFLAVGTTPSDVSILFAWWAAVALVGEVPSGAVADRVDRRGLLAVALVLRAVGIAVWLVVPTFAGLATGVALWAVHMALASGAWEAYVYDVLVADDQEAAYATVMARLGQASLAATAIGTLSGAALLGLGAPLVALGWITVALHLPAIALVLALPAAAPTEEPDESEDDGWWATLRAGVSEAVGEPSILRLVVLGAVLEGLFVLDEYAPMLSEIAGASPASTALVVFVVWLGLLAGGEVAARRPRLAPGVLGTVLAVTAGLSCVALATGSVAGVAGLAVAYGGLQLTWVLYEARFQGAIVGTARATSTSVRAFGGAVLNIGFFAFVALLGDDPTVGVVLALGVLVLVGPLVRRWVPAVPRP
jgi:MFS family permease